mmetsp:Transcript_35043/g.90028  ORF Transcript_35043/g.90028 Transcript_35043/m.90028 type:complete len:108 (+) Transcript_35043:179-502(+)
MRTTGSRSVAGEESIKYAEQLWAFKTEHGTYRGAPCGGRVRRTRANRRSWRRAKAWFCRGVMATAHGITSSAGCESQNIGEHIQYAETMRGQRHFKHKEHTRGPPNA